MDWDLVTVAELLSKLIMLHVELPININKIIAEGWSWKVTGWFLVYGIQTIFYSNHSFRKYFKPWLGMSYAAQTWYNNNNNENFV